MSHAELAYLRQAFNELNGNIVPRQGMTYKIPLPFEATDDFGNVVDTPKPNLLDEDGAEIIETPKVEEIKTTDPIVQKPEDPPKLVRVKPVLQVFS